MYYKLSMRQSFQKVRASRFLGDNSNFGQTFSEISLECVHIANIANVLSV